MSEPLDGMSDLADRYIEEVKSKFTEKLGGWICNECSRIVRPEDFVEHTCEDESVGRRAAEYEEDNPFSNLNPEHRRVARFFSQCASEAQTPKTDLDSFIIATRGVQVATDIDNLVPGGVEGNGGNYDKLLHEWLKVLISDHR